MFQINPKIPNFQPHSPNTHISSSFLHLYCLTTHFVLSPRINLSVSLFLHLCLCFSLCICFALFFLSFFSLCTSLQSMSSCSYAQGWERGSAMWLRHAHCPQCLKIPSCPESSVLQPLCSPNTLPQHPLITPLLIFSHKPHRVSFQVPTGIFKPPTPTISVILLPMVLLGVLSKMFLSPAGSLAVPRDSSRGHYQLSWWQPPACTLCLWEQCRIVWNQ